MMLSTGFFMPTFCLCGQAIAAGWGISCPCNPDAAEALLGHNPVTKKERVMLYKDDKYSRKLRERAYMLADSGQFDGWRYVEKALIGEGWENSHIVLGSSFMRMALDERCAAAREATTH